VAEDGREPESDIAYYDEDTAEEIYRALPVMRIVAALLEKLREREQQRQLEEHPPEGDGPNESEAVKKRRSGVGENAMSTFSSSAGANAPSGGLGV